MQRPAGERYAVPTGQSGRGSVPETEYVLNNKLPTTRLYPPPRSRVAREPADRATRHQTMTRKNVTEDDEGKRVIDATGEEVGVITGIRGDTAYVDPDPGITDRVKTMLGWEDVDAEDFPLERDRIDTITEDEVRLTENR